MAAIKNKVLEFLMARKNATLSERSRSQNNIHSRISILYII